MGQSAKESDGSYAIDFSKKEIMEFVKSKFKKPKDHTMYLYDDTMIIVMVQPDRRKAT